jgi:hypothetical protein
MDEHGQVSNKNMTWKTMGEGTSTSIVAAFDPSIAGESLSIFCKLSLAPNQSWKGQSGAYLEDCHIGETSEDYITDPEAPEKLWSLSEKLVGQTFKV